MTYEPNDPRNRPLGGPGTFGADPRDERSPGMAWGGLAVIAALIIGGFLWYNSGRDTGTRTASVPTTTQSAPAPSAPASLAAPR